MAWPEEDGLIGDDDMYAANPYPPRWVGIPRMNGTHNLARAGAAAQQNAVEVGSPCHSSFPCSNTSAPCNWSCTITRHLLGASHYFCETPMHAR